MTRDRQPMALRPLADGIIDMHPRFTDSPMGSRHGGKLKTRPIIHV